jgi:hypothetical protein
MTVKDDVERLELEPPEEPRELSAWFTNSLRPDLANAPELATVPADAAPVADPSDTLEAAVEVEAAVDPETAFSPNPESLEPTDEALANAPAAPSAGHSLTPHVLPTVEDELDTPSGDEPPLAPPVTPWLPGSRGTLLTTAIGASAILASIAFLVLSRSCTATDTSAAAPNLEAVPPPDPPQALATDQPPAPTPAEPANSAGTLEAEPQLSSPLRPLPPGFAAPDFAPDDSSSLNHGPAVARFPDLPPDVLLKVWREEQEEAVAK